MPLHIFTSFCVFELCLPPITIMQSTSFDSSLAENCLSFVAEQIVFLKTISFSLSDSFSTIELYKSKLIVVCDTTQYFSLASKFN